MKKFIFFIFFLPFLASGQKDAFIIYHEADFDVERKVWTSIYFPKSHDTLSYFVYPTEYYVMTEKGIEDSIYYYILSEIENLMVQKYQFTADSICFWGCTSFVIFDGERNITAKYTLPNLLMTTKFMIELINKHEGDDRQKYFKDLFGRYLYQLQNE